MAKPDPARDYYGELGLTSGADITEINKQYRKLALKCHPDRNPGKEAEFNAKFQDIKSAQEILTDPVLRAQYDAERARVGHGRGYVPQRPGVPSRNPYQANSNFPPPPSRTNPRPAYNSTPSSGANRYNNVPKPATNTGGREEARTRANAFRAFEHMNKTAQPTPRSPTARRPVPPPRDAGGKPAVPPRNPSAKPPMPPRPRSGWESFGGKGGADPGEKASPGMQRAHSTRASRKAGFAPGKTGGDEPVVSGSSSYFDTTRGSARPTAPRSQTEQQPSMPPPPPGPPPNHRRGQPSDPLSDFKAQYADLGLQSPRVRTPYATQGGEKTYFSSATLGRSGTVKGTSTDAYTPPGRHRSASPPRSRAYSSSTKSGFRTGPSSPERGSPQRTKSEAGLHPGLHPSTAAAPHEHISRAGTPGHGSGSSGDEPPRSDTESPTFMERLARKRQEKERRGRRAHHNRVYPSYDPYANPTANESEYAHASHPPHNTPPPRPPKGPAPAFGDPWASKAAGDAKDDGNSRSSTYAANPFDLYSATSSFFSASGWTAINSSYAAAPHRDPFISGDGATSPLLPSSPPHQYQNGYHRHEDPNAPKREPGLWFEWRPEKYQANKTSATSSFTFEVDDETFTPTKPASNHPPRPTNSADNIDTDFPTAAFDGRFTAATSQPGPSDNGSRSPSRRSSPGKDPTGINGAPPIPPPKEALPAMSPGQATFRPEDWAGEKYAWDPMDHTPVSPNRGMSLNGKRSEPRLKHARSRGISRTNTGSTKRAAMPANVSGALDETDDESEVGDVASKDGGGIEIRESLADSMDIDPSSPPNLSRPTSTQPPSAKPSTTPPIGHQRPSSTPSATHARASSTSGGAPLHNLDLDDLHNVEPFAPAPTFGRSGMLNDLSSTLPFDSRAAAHPPIATDSDSSDNDKTIPGLAPLPKIALPLVPRQPVTPKTLSPTAWELYLANIQAYLAEWTAFNDRMLGHFNDRQRDVKERLLAGGIKGNWVGRKGEGPDGGYLRYMQGLEEDVQIREHWDVAWERHREAMRVFGRIKAKIVEGKRRA